MSIAGLLGQSLLLNDLYQKDQYGLRGPELQTITVR